mmetsp:Transcript_9271/g.21393  ORF Transcript_9271/g.21393 Transcript_9271/m.21393 type:complete len:100 (-) Transcript_9271:103-402(-)
MSLAGVLGRSLFTFLKRNPLAFSHSVPGSPVFEISRVSRVWAPPMHRWMDFGWVQWQLLISSWEESSIWNMSSTLKKRRAKMNKHKLRKRRKKLRQRNK